MSRVLFEHLSLGDRAELASQVFYANGAAMVIASQSDLRIIEVNSRWLELFEATREDVIGRTSVELGLIAESVATTRVAQHAERTETFDVELPLRTRTGRNLVVLATAKPIELPQGRYTLTTLIDITARKQAEEAFTAAFNASPAGLVLVDDATNVVVSVNDRMLEMTGWGRADLVGHPVDRIAVIQPPQHVLVELARAGKLANLEIQLGRRDGTGVWTLGSAELITLHGVRHRLSAFTDITALRELNLELERRVQDRTQALEATNRDLEAFTSSVSHDLRAPLRTINGFSSILLVEHSADLSPEVNHLLGRIRAGGERMQRLVEDLLAFSRLGRTELQRTTIDLDAMVKSVVEELVAARDLGARLDLRLSPLGSCDADPTLLRAVWTNLIDNALKYSRERERAVVEIGVEQRGAERVYFVRDNGVGFDSAYADKLFGMFQRLHSAKQFEGNGVGLANVRRIVERHHGRVAAHSELGRGATFEFTLGVV